MPKNLKIKYNTNPEADRRMPVQRNSYKIKEAGEEQRYKHIMKDRRELEWRNNYKMREAEDEQRNNCKIREAEEEEENGRQQEENAKPNLKESLIKQ